MYGCRHSILAGFRTELTLLVLWHGTARYGGCVFVQLAMKARWGLCRLLLNCRDRRLLLHPYANDDWDFKIRYACEADSINIKLRRLVAEVASRQRILSE